MKLVIEVKEEDYKRYKEDKICSYTSAVLDAVPLNEVLDKISAEIQAMPTDYCGGYIGLDKQEVLKIIDRYTKDGE